MRSFSSVSPEVTPFSLYSEAADSDRPPVDLFEAEGKAKYKCPPWSVPEPEPVVIGDAALNKLNCSGFRLLLGLCNPTFDLVEAVVVLPGWGSSLALWPSLLPPECWTLMVGLVETVLVVLVVLVVASALILRSLFLNITLLLQTFGAFKIISFLFF